MSFLFEELSREECEEIREQDGYAKGLSEGDNQGFERGNKQGLEKGIKQGLEKGDKQGFERGIKQGIAVLVEICEEMGLTREETKMRIMQKFSLPAEKVESYMEQCWFEKSE